MLRIRFYSIQLTVAGDATDVHASSKPSFQNKNAPEVGTVLVTIAKDVVDGGRGHGSHGCKCTLLALLEDLLSFLNNAFKMHIEDNPSYFSASGQQPVKCLES